MKTEKNVTGYPFVSHVDQNLRPQLPVDFLDKAYTKFYTNNDNLINYGCYKLMGYIFDFKPYLKAFSMNVKLKSGAIFNPKQSVSIGNSQ